MIKSVETVGEDNFDDHDNSHDANKANGINKKIIKKVMIYLITIVIIAIKL